MREIIRAIALIAVFAASAFAQEVKYIEAPKFIPYLPDPAKSNGAAGLRVLRDQARQNRNRDICGNVVGR